jgi:sugar lactone lactonase YvrE
VARLWYTLPAVVILAGTAFAVLSGSIEPAVYRPQAKPPLEGPLAPNRLLENVELVGSGRLQGPEDPEPDGAGRVYCGLADGTIRRVVPAVDGERVELFAETGGRPLGLDFDRFGTLWVADRALGLVAVDPRGHAAVRVDEADGVAIGYADDVDVAPDGRIYFSDASTRFSPEELHLEALEGRPWGRLVEFGPADDRARVLLDDLYFANGVAVSPDGSFVLVAETFRYRIRRYWLRGARAGEDEVFVDNLPGFPDGVSSDGRGGFWVALFSVRSDLLDRLVHPRPWLKHLIARIPAAFQSGARAYGLLVALDAEGDYVLSLHDPTGRRFPHVTSVEERDGFLYLGSAEQDALGRYRLQ